MNTREMERDQEEDMMETMLPLVNIQEREDAVVLEAEMPGLLKEDIELELEGEALTLRGRTRGDQAPTGATVLLQERAPAHYQRTFLLGADLDRSKISAAYDNGILRVTVAKAESAKPHRIAIG